jgi:hypothetical protein
MNTWAWIQESSGKVRHSVDLASFAGEVWEALASLGFVSTERSQATL